MPKFANPADKLSTIASEPWKELKVRVTIVELAEFVRIKQIEYVDIATNLENEINHDLLSNFTEVAKQREVSIFIQYLLLVERGWLHVKRNPISMNFLVFLAVYNSLLWGSVFYQVAAQKVSIRTP